MKQDGNMPRPEQRSQGDLQRFAAPSGADGANGEVSSPRRTATALFHPIHIMVRTTLVDVRAEQSGVLGLMRVSGRWTRKAATLVLRIDVAHPTKRFDDQI